jgi:outer membrane protein assembly factor BamA
MMGRWLPLIALFTAWSVAGIAAESVAPPATGTIPWPRDAELEAQGVRIGSVTIRNRTIFDPEVPAEDRALYRLADRLHVDTRKSTVEAQLLFRSGDLYSRRVLDETERNLRELGFIHEPAIRVIGYHDGLVDLEVVIREVWTTNLGTSLGRAGGKTSYGLLLEERNLLGFGKQVSFSYHHDVDRSSYALGWLDPSIGGSRWRNAVTLTDSNDGNGTAFLLERPFYSLDTRWSAGVSSSQRDSIESVYRLGHVVSEYQRDAQAADLRFGWSEGLRNGWAHRWSAGLRHEETQFSDPPDATIPVTLPQDRRLNYPFLRFERIQDDFKTARNLDQIARTEDQHFGSRLSLELGMATTALDSDRNAAVLRAAASRGFRLGDSHSLFVSGGLTSRIEDGSARDMLLSGELRHYRKTSPRSTLFTSLSGDVGHNLDADHELSLGGDTGLRGYPLKYQNGSGRALLTIEQRYYTKRSLWGLADIGAAVFFDIGRTWGDSAFGPTGGRGVLKDVGFGLRLGKNRSALGDVQHFDIAFPLDGDHSIDQVQILVHTKHSF